MIFKKGVIAFIRLVKRRLWAQIAVILSLVVTLSLVLFSALLIRSAQNAVSKSVLINHREIAVRAAAEIELFISRAEDLLHTTSAMLGTVYPSAWKEETILVELVLDQPLFMRVSAVDLSGKELASSEIARGLSWNYPREALLSARERKTYVSEVKMLEESTPYVTMAVPVRRMGKIVQVLVADANLRGIWDIIDSIQIGNTGRAFLVSEEGNLIAHQDKKKVLKKENVSFEHDVQSVNRGRSGALELKDSKGNLWISSYAPISGLGWGLVLRQERQEAYYFSRVMILRSALILLLSIILAVLCSIVVACFMTRPAKVLVTSMKKVAAGDLNNKLDTRREDEMGEMISAFNEMTEKLQKAKAEEKLAAIGTAASRISHELKNSLVVIKAFVQMFPRKYKDEKFAAKFNRLVPEEIQRWEHMLKELTDFSLQTSLNPVRMNLALFLKRTVEIMEQAMSKQNIAAQCLLQGKIYIRGDQEKLKQVFINLFINASHAMPDGGRLLVSAKKINKRNGSRKVEIRVSDSGTGIPLAEREKIFDPFYTSGKGGMGLGLAISRKIIEEHGGSIFAGENQEGGAVFVIELPLIPEQELRPEEK